MKATTTKTIPGSLAASAPAGVQFFPGVESSNTVASWSDSQLILAVRCEPPNEVALDVLIDRYWNSVFGRCQMLTANREKALDLAQATWYRMLRARHTLKPDGNLLAYLTKISTNLFRDSYRSARRAGPLADFQLTSLDGACTNDENEEMSLESILPDLNALRAGEHARLKMDIDAALERLTPQLREILVARFIQGESCAEIGLRHGRTEQTVSGWVREALRQMKIQLEEPHCEDKEWKSADSQLVIAASSLECAV
jgi:RNA polymerase sigma-70 factor (ECF subfamily)